MAHIINATATREFLKKLKIAVNLKVTEIQGIAYFSVNDLTDVLETSERNSLLAEVTSLITLDDTRHPKNHI